MPGYAHIHALLQMELEQRIEEGCDLDREEWVRRIESCGSRDIVALGDLYEELAGYEPPADTPFEEPASLKVIRALRPNGVRDMGAPEDERQTFDRIHGGWLGRCVGNTLGRPFMTPPFTASEGMRQRREIRRWLVGADAWPLEDYVPGESRAAQTGLAVVSPSCTRGQVRSAEPDEALHGALAVLAVFEAAGGGFATEDVAQTWLNRVPFGQMAQAQAQAFLNIVDDEAFARTNLDAAARAAVDWERVATHLNPYREWNGAAMRADIFGMAAPGKSELAAEMAWRDARLAHTKSGLYAAMFIAAVTAAAFRETDPENLVDIGLSEIPGPSRLGGAVRDVMRIARETEDWQACWDRAMERYGFYGALHAIPNVLVCTMALLYGEGDFGKSIGLAVSGGLCPAANGATVGAILGVRHSSRGLTAQWVTPLANTFRSNVLGFTRGTMSDMARRLREATRPAAQPES